jgi:hypothetical protein
LIYSLAFFLIDLKGRTISTEAEEKGKAKLEQHKEKKRDY